MVLHNSGGGAMVLHNSVLSRILGTQVVKLAG
jgi:hypothetical protein